MMQTSIAQNGLVSQLRLIVIICLVVECKGLVSYLSSLSIIGPYYQYSFLGVSSSSSNFIFMLSNPYSLNTYYPAMSTIFPTTTSSPLIKYSSQIYNGSYQLRTFPSNSVSSSTNSFLIFSPTSVSVTNNNFQTINVIYQINNTSTQVIKDVMFGSNTSQILILTQNLSLGNYSVSYFINNIKVSKIFTNMTNSVSYINAGVSLNKFVTTFKTGILVYMFSSVANISTLVLEKWILFTNSSSKIISMSVYDIYLTYCFGISCFVCDINSSYSIIDSFNKTADVFDIQISPPYIFIMSGTILQQYDMDLKSVINSTNTLSIGLNNLTNYRMFILYSKFIIFYKAYPIILNTLFVYAYDNTTVCLTNKNCTSCSNTYYLNTTQGKCVKNYTNLGISMNNLTDIPIQNVTATNNTMSQSNNALPSPTPISPQVPIQNNDTVSQITTKSLQVKVMQSFGKSLTFLTLKFSPKFLISLTLFLDDLWYYKFHRHNYTQSVKTFMQKIDIINQLRLSPWFMDALSFINQNDVGIEKNLQYLECFTYSQNNPDSIYFLNSSQQVYKGFIINLCFSFLALKLLQFLFYFLKKRFTLCMKIFQIIRLNSSAILFISGLIEPNTIILAFNFSIQILIPISFDKFDKVNINSAVLTYFWLLIYSISYYILICNYANKKNTKTLLARSKHNLQGCLSQTLSIVFRNLLRATIHGLFIQSYQSQIICLTLSDFLMIVFTLFLNKRFLNKFLFSFVLLYNLFFFVVDFLFYLNYRNPELMIEYYDNFIFILIMILIVLSILISITILITGIKDIVKKNIICNNSIMEQIKKEQIPTNRNFTKNYKGQYQIKVKLQNIQTNQQNIQTKYKTQKQVFQNDLSNKIFVKINNFCVKQELSFSPYSMIPSKRTKYTQKQGIPNQNKKESLQSSKMQLKLHKVFHKFN